MSEPIGLAIKLSITQGHSFYDKSWRFWRLRGLGLKELMDTDFLLAERRYLRGSVERRQGRMHFFVLSQGMINLSEILHGRIVLLLYKLSMPCASCSSATSIAATSSSDISVTESSSSIAFS